MKELDVVCRLNGLHKSNKENNSEGIWRPFLAQCQINLPYISCDLNLWSLKKWCSRGLNF